MLVYIAGPYSTAPDGSKATPEQVLENVKRAIRVGDRVAKEGHTPIIPHLNHLWDEHSTVERDWQAWMEWCLEVVGYVRDAGGCLLRMGGPSPGGDIEQAHANAIGMDVVSGIEDLIWLAGLRAEAAAEVEACDE